MAGINGLGTTYGLPNYVGELENVSPADTPLLTAIGGLHDGGESVKSTTIQWQEDDLRTAEPNRSRLEGASAPTADNRVRRNVTNVLEIHQETVEVSFTKQAATGLHSGANISGDNPVNDEIARQTALALKAKAIDIEQSFILGRKHVPSDNSTARKTGGLLEAIATNVIDLGEAHDGLAASTDTITETATTLADGDAVRFTSVGVSTAIIPGVVYYVVGKTTNAFKVSATKGGSAITIGTATVSLRKVSGSAPTKDTYDELFEKVYTAGGMGGDATTLVLGPTQKRKLSKAYADAFGKYQEESRTVAGVNFQTIVTDFGLVNVLLDRHIPKDTVILANLDLVKPVFLEIDGKGHFFEEELAKTGASYKTMLYGEVGLKWGNELAHGVIKGLPV